MSATLQRGLASLLVRRTEDGRANARHAVEAWQKAIGAVRQAEKMAGRKIRLPTEQVQGVQQAAAQVHAAIYVLAVYLANKATLERNSVMATATGALQREIEHCQRVEAMAEQELQTAISKRDRDITAAKQENDADIQKIYKETTGSVRDLELGLDDGVFKLITVAIVVAFVVYGDFIVHDSSTRLLLAPVIWGGLVIVMVRVLPDTVTWLRKARAKAEQRSRTAVAETVFTKAVEAAEKRLREIRTVLEERISQGEAHHKKAEQALEWLKAQD
jgi:hypothetical protein